jgi:hypothetical protein
MSYFIIVRHYFGNVRRFVTIPWQQRNISMSEATNIFACSFDSNGWHHIVRTLIEYNNNPDIPLSETTLYKYLKNYCPGNISDLAGCKRDSSNIPLFYYPWGMSFRQSGIVEKNVWQSRFCGPSSDVFIEEEFKRIIALYMNMKKTGYKPWRTNNGFIGGSFLLKNNGQKRFVVLQGNHRMAVLSFLDKKRLSVRTIKGYLPVVKESEVKEWPFVKNGLFTEDEALKIFNLFFIEKGYHIKALLNNQ